MRLSETRGTIAGQKTRESIERLSATRRTGTYSEDMGEHLGVLDRLSWRHPLFSSGYLEEF